MASEAQITQVTDKLRTPLPARREGWTVSKSTGYLIGRVLTYLILTFGGMVMFFPMFWMLSASLKPEWQILTQPLGIPSEWIHVQAGDTPADLPLWKVTDPDGEEIRAIEIGSRRYTTVIDAAQLGNLISVPSDQLSEATTTTVEGVQFNVRTWSSDEGTQDVVALARDGDNLVVAPVDDLVAASARMALAEVNSGDRAPLELQDYRFLARELEDGRTVIPLGPESQLTVVASQDVAEHIMLVNADVPVDPELVPLGETELEVYRLEGHDPDERFVLLSSEVWQPIINLDVAREYGLSVRNDQLAGEREMREFGLATLPVDTMTAEDGQQMEVVLLLQSSMRSFVVPLEYSDTIRLSPISKLAEPFVETIDRTAIRYRDDYEEQGERVEVGIVGERRNVALVIPQSAISEAFDVAADAPERVTEIRLRIENYIDALSRDLGGATFLTFFRNSGIVVLLNLIGHFLSVTIVAYGFARLRAPGKNALFVIVLATMMLPWPVMLIPQYEIFQQLGMINTLWPLFIRAFFGNAFLIFLLRQFFMGIPRELEEAALIDGASVLQVLWHVMLPLSKPALATIGIFTFWWTWNSFLEPYVYLSSVKNFTVSLGLGFFKSQYAYTFHLLMAASVIAILPIITLFFFAQRYFIEGIQLTGLKG